MCIKFACIWGRHVNDVENRSAEAASSKCILDLTLHCKYAAFVRRLILIISKLICFALPLSGTYCLSTMWLSAMKRFKVMQASEWLC